MTVHQRPNIDWPALCEPVARIVWGKPQPTSEKSKELRWGTNGSRSVDRENGCGSITRRRSAAARIDLVPVTGTREKMQWLRDHGLIDDDVRRSNGRDKAPPSKQAPPPWERPIAATYDYTDEDGVWLFEIMRFSDGLQPRFIQRRGERQWNLDGVRRVLYRLPRLLRRSLRSAPSSSSRARRTPTPCAPPVSSPLPIRWGPGNGNPRTVRCCVAPTS